MLNSFMARNMILLSGMRLPLLHALLALAIAAVYGQFLWNPTVFDDNNFFGGATHPQYLKDFFRFEFRWLPYASFEWTRVVLGREIIWYRLGNLALHIAVAAALFGFLRKLFEAALPTAPAAVDGPVSTAPLSFFWLAFFGALIFALHPAAVYAAAYLIQRTILMATLFTLLMWYLFLKGLTQGNRWWLIASAGAYLMAVFSKEHAIMAPAVALAMLILLRKPTVQLLRQVWPAFALYAVVGAYVVFQFRSGNLLGQAYEPRGMDMLSLLSGLDAGFDVRLAYPLSVLTQSFLFFKYLLVWLLPSPAWMSVDMFEPFAMRLWSWPHSTGLIGFIVYPVVATWLLFKRGKNGLLGLGMLCPWLMFATELSTIRIQESFVLYRSYLWMPGALVALPFLFQRTPAKRAAIVLTALALVMTPVTWERLQTFSSPFLLWHDAARLIKEKDSRPGVERIYHNRGLALSKLQYFDEAVTDYNKAIALNPQHLLAYNDRGATYLEARNYAAALNDFNNAIVLNPKFARPYLGRALAYEALNDPAAALENYKQLCSLGYVEGCTRIKLGALAQ